MSTRFWVLSDLHLEFHRIELPVVEFDAVILAGDIHTPGTRAIEWATSVDVFQDKPVYYVPGNHEFYDRDLPGEMEAMRRACRGSRVQLLDCEQAILGSVRLLGCTLWTDFELPTRIADGRLVELRIQMKVAQLGMSDYFAIWQDTPSGRRLLTPQVTRQIHRAHYQWLAAQIAKPWAGQTVVVTHHAPSRRSVSARFVNDSLSPAFASDLPSAVFEGVDLWVHGHMHDSFDYRVGGDGGSCRVVCNPRGYPMRMTQGVENEAFLPGLVIEV